MPTCCSKALHVWKHINMWAAFLCEEDEQKPTKESSYWYTPSLTKPNPNIDELAGKKRCQASSTYMVSFCTFIQQPVDPFQWMFSGHSLALDIVLVLALSVFEFDTLECLSRRPISWLTEVNYQLVNWGDTANTLIIPITAHQLSLVFTSLIYCFSFHCLSSYISKSQNWLTEWI